MENPKWRLALKKFLDRYINENWFEGAILCGSYSTGNQNEFSDIDVIIVTRNDIGWREKSNCYVDGFLMEYTINPIKKIEEYMDSGVEQHRLIDQNMFVYGEVLSDKHGEVARLRQKASEQLSTPLDPISEFAKSFTKYHLWDCYDELNSLHRKGWHIDLQYWSLVDMLITAYYDFNNFMHVPHSKIEKLLFDKKFAENYHIPDQTSKEFKDLLLLCFEAKTNEDKLQTIKNLYDYVIASGGGFDIGKFRGYSEIPDLS